MTATDPEQPAADAGGPSVPAANQVLDQAPKRGALQIPASPSRARDRPPLALSRTAREAPRPAPPAVPQETAPPSAEEAPPAARRRPASSGPAAPKYARLARRDMLITAAQSAGLAALTAEVMSDPRRPQVASGDRERITDATLVRVAIDLLLTHHGNDLSGVTEDELRASVGLPPLQF